MFKFVHVPGFGALGKNQAAVRERLYVARPKKNWVGGGVGFFNLAKSGPEKNLPCLFDRLTASGI